MNLTKEMKKKGIKKAIASEHNKIRGLSYYFKSASSPSGGGPS